VRLSLQRHVRRLHFCVALLAGCVAFVACGGGHSTPSAPNGSLPAGKGRVTFRIDVPATSASAKHRAPRYISPATTQLALTIDQGGSPLSGYPTTVPLTPTSSGCSSTLASTYCQLSIVLGLGSYTASLTAEDANGTALSQAQAIPFTVADNSTNVVNLILSGIPHALQLAPGAAAVHQLSGGSFVIYGATPAPVVVNAVDADGNTIVGVGAPSFTATLVNGSGGWTIATPPPTEPNALFIDPPGQNGSGATFSVTAVYSDGTCSSSGAVCTMNFTARNDIQTLFVANGSGTTVNAYTAPYGEAPATLTGVSVPYALAMDGGGDLFVLSLSNPAAVAEFTAPYGGAPVLRIPAGTAPRGIALDASARLFIAASYAPSGFTNEVVSYAPPYTGTAATCCSGTVVNQSTQPLVLDNLGNLFVAYSGEVQEYPSEGSGSPTTIGFDVLSSSVTWIALDAAGDLFVCDYGFNQVLIYAPPYTGTPTILGTTNDINNPVALLVDGSGNLFVANSGNNTVTEYVPPYSGAPLHTISTGRTPLALALDGAANLLVANAGGNTVTEYAPPYTGAAITTIGGLSAPSALLLTP
jgi:hypothetical protein